MKIRKSKVAGRVVAMTIVMCAWQVTAADLDWVHETIDPTTPVPLRDVGIGASMVVDPTIDRPIIAYADSSGVGLHLATFVGSGGNCGRGLSWQCSDIDNATVGEALDLTYYHQDLVWVLGAVFRDTALNQMIYWEKRWVAFPVPGHWQISREVVHEGTSWISAGRQVALDYGPSGVPVIASWSSSTIFDDALWVSARVGTGGNCGGGDAAGAWNCSQVETGAGVGQHPSIVVWPIAGGGYPMIVYYAGGGELIRIAEYNGFTTSGCNTGAAGWNCMTLEAGIENCGGTSIVRSGSVDDYFVRAAYLVLNDTETWGAVRVAQPKPDGGTGNCAGDAWWCYALELTGGSPSGEVAVGIDASEQTFVAYRRSAEADLRIARHHDNIVIEDACGPEGSPLPFKAWSCQTAAPASATADPGGWLDLAFVPSGEPVLTYRAFDNGTGAGALMLAHPWIFRDGFETGNTNAW